LIEIRGGKSEKKRPGREGGLRKSICATSPGYPESEEVGDFEKRVAEGGKPRRGR